jgi:FkbM family methyltransferase
MTFIVQNEDVFLLCDVLTGRGPITIEDDRVSGSNPVACNIDYRPAGNSTAKVNLRWNKISQTRLDAGDAVDLTVEISRSGIASAGDTLDFVFPAQPSTIYDPDFATVAAASFSCTTPDVLGGVEMFINNENGPQHSLPIAVDAIGHASTGHQFSAVPSKASLSIRLHLKPTTSHEERLTIRFARLFLGVKYDPYVFNPWYEHSAFVNKLKRTVGFAKIADEFVASARELSKTHKFSASQSFIYPFEVIREGTPPFPMLCGTINSLYWYGLKPSHGVEEYQESGFIVPGDVVFDCGAHAGQMSALFGHLIGKAGKVVSFEPFPQNYLQVEAQAKLNKTPGFKSTRAGVGEKTETVSVPNAVQMILANSYDHGLNDHLEIQIHRIDDYIKLKPTAIKLDIEGAEVAAMRGAQKVLRECKPKILCEFHTQLVGQFGHTVQDFFDAIPLDLYHVTYSEEGLDGAWHTYTGVEKQVWKMPGTIKAFPK